MKRYVMNEEKADVLESLGFEFENKFSVPIWTRRDVIKNGQLGYFEMAYPDYELYFYADDIPGDATVVGASYIIEELLKQGVIKEVKS